MKKIFTIFSLLLLCSTVALADEEKVIIADDITNGTVSYAIDGSTVTLTVTPAEGYYLEALHAVKTINVSNIAGTRAEGPAMGAYTLSRTSQSADLSAVATYTFTLPDNLGARVTAEFAARTTITADQITLSGTSFTYDRSVHLPSVQVGSLTSGTDYTVSYSNESAVDAGTYTVTVTGMSRYKGESTASWTINKRKVSVSAVAQTKAFGDDDPALTYNVEGLLEGDELTGALSRVEGEDVDEYDITQGTLAASNNYDLTFTDAKFTITKRPLTITAEDKTKVFGTEDPELTFKVEGLLDGDEIPGALVRAEGENVGEYAITQGTVTANSNYNISFVPGKFTITAATINMTVTPCMADYDGKAHTIVVNAGSDVTVKFGTVEGTYNLTEVPTFTDAGKYTVYYQAEKTNYATVTSSAKVIINKKKVTVAAQNNTKVYGQTDPELIYTADGLLGSDALTGALSRVAGEDVNEYDITQGTLAASDNYSITFTGAKFTITKRPLTITAEAKSKVEGAQDPELTYTVEGLVEGDKLTGALARAEGETVGEYVITQGSLAASNNYSVTFTGAKFTITAAENPNKPNESVVDPNKTTQENDELFYELDPKLQESIGKNIDVEIGVSGYASQNVSVNNGNIIFEQGESSADILLMGQKAEDVITMNVEGKVTANSDDLVLVGNSGTRGTRSGNTISLVSGAQYRVLHDGNVVLTLVLTEAPVTISGIHLTSAGSTGISLTPTASTNEGVWHDLNGRKFSSKPTKKGVYIHQGAKVVIK